MDRSELPISSCGKERSSGDTEKLNTAFLYDDIYLEHQTPEGFPERSERLVAIVERLEKEGLLSQLLRPTYSVDGLKWIPAVHHQRYIARVRDICRQGDGFIDCADVPVSAQSYEAAVAAAGGAPAVVDAVIEGKVRNGFCAVRPPGHHALADRAMGFCIFNNIAIAARYIQKKHKLTKVLIVDWDVHHGNGTQAAFYDDPDVLYFSIHHYPFYPGSGGEDESGSGEGLGYTINVPLPAGCGDLHYCKAFEEILTPAAQAFKPDFVLVSAGFDAHESDPLGGMNVTAEGFAQLTKIVKLIAEQLCQGRLVCLLEGGYDLEGLADSVQAHIKVLMENDK